MIQGVSFSAVTRLRQLRLIKYQRKCEIQSLSVPPRYGPTPANTLAEILDIPATASAPAHQLRVRQF